MSIHKEAININWRDNRSVVDFYNSNRSYMDNFKNTSSQDEIDILIIYKLHYCNTLLDLTEYDKIHPIINEIEILLPKLSQSHKHFKENTIQLMFLKGAILYYKKEYKDALPIFKELVKISPNRYQFKTWLNCTKLKLYDKLFNTLYLISGVIIITDMILFINEVKIIDIGNVGIILLAVTWSSQYFLNKYFNKKKSIS